MNGPANERTSQWLHVATTLGCLTLASLRAQSCDSSTGAGGGTQGSQCVDNSSAVTVDRSGPGGLLHAAWNGEDALNASVPLPPGSTKTPTELQGALSMVANGGLVLATGGEFRQAVTLLQTHGFDSRHPFRIGLGYRSYEVDYWRTYGDAVGTFEDPFGPGWRASWGDMLTEINESGQPVVRIDENGVRWSHSQVASQTVIVGPMDSPTTWRVYDAQASTRLVLEYCYVGNQTVPIWFREWPDRTRVEYFHPAGASGTNLVAKRIYRGSYSSPDWQVTYSYDATSARLLSITDARGIVHSLTWTTYGATARVTKLTTTVPTSWSPNWSAIETNFEYETASPYRLARVRKPARAFLDDQDRSGAYESADSFDHEVTTYFTYNGSSNRIEKVFDESTGMSRQMLELTYNTSLVWQVHTMTEGVSSSLPGQGARVQTFTYGTSPDSACWTDARGVQRTYVYTKTVGGVTYASPRQWRVTSLSEVSGSNDPRPTTDADYHGTLTWGFEWGCGCGQITGITMPSGLKHVIAYDTAGRGLVTKTAVLPVGQSTEQQVRAWSYRSWDDSDYRLASRLSGYTDACNKTGSNTFTYDSGYGGYRVDGTFDGVTQFSFQEDSTERVIWTEEGGFQVDGGSTTSHARVGYTYGTSSSSPDCGLLTAVSTYGANGTTVYSTRYFSYEGLGWLHTMTDELSRSATINHNTIGQLTTVVMPTTSTGRGSATYGSTVTLEHDRYGQVARTKTTAHDDQGSAYSHAEVVQTEVFDYFSRPWKTTTDTTKLGQSTATSVVTISEYDLGNRLVRVDDAGGRVTEYKIDDHGQLYQQRKKIDGSTWSVEQHGYNVDGVIARVADPTGLVGTITTFDEKGRPTLLTFPGDKHLSLTLDNEDRVTQEEFSTGSSSGTVLQTKVVSYNYLGQKLNETISGPGVTTVRSVDYTYNGPFKVATAIDGDGRGVVYGYDAQGRLVRKQDLLLGSAGNAEVYTRDSVGNVTRVDQAEQKQTDATTYTTETSRIDLAYDGWDRLLRAEFYGTSGSIQFTRYNGYDSLGNATWAKDGVGKETRRAFDSAGRIVDEWLHQRTYSATPVHLTRTYNDAPSDSLLSAILQRADGIGNTSEYHYDLLGRLVERRLPGYTSGQIAKQWLYVYDQAGRLTEWRDGNGTRVRQVYDSTEKKLVERRVISLPTNNIFLSFMATHETWGYDDFGRVVSAHTWWNTYPEFTQNAQPPNLVEAVKAYDGIGRQTEETFRFLDDDASGYNPLVTKSLTYAYATGSGGEDSSFRRTMQTSAGFTIGTTPDGVGRLAAMTLSGPSITTQALADWRYVGNRPLRRSFLPGVATGNELVTDYSYNALRHMTQLTTSRVVNGVSTGIYSLGMERDVEGNVTQHQVTKKSGVGDWFQLDGWDRLQEAKLGVNTFSTTYANAQFDKKVTYALDMAHNRSQVDETTSGGTTETTQYTRRSGTNEYSAVATTSGGSQNWTYDGNGNLLSDGYYLYVYDHLDRLSEVYLLTYPGGATDMTAAGPVVRVYGVVPQQQRDGKETAVPTQLWREKVEQARQRVAAARASANRPASDPRIPSGANAGTTGTAAAVIDEPVPVLIAYYGYDPSNRRIGKLLADYSAAFYCWSGWDLIEAYDAWFQPTTVWFEGAAIDEHLGYATKVNGSWVRYGYVQDHLRGIAQVTDAAGNVVERYEYDPYGKMSVFTGAWVANGSVPTVPGQVYGFTGRQLDAETGLVFFRSRYYQVAHGVFITRDMYGSWFDTYANGNPYSYCGGLPINHWDPMGQNPWSPEAHNALLEHAFKGKLAPSDIDFFKRVSKEFDEATQGPGEEFKHGMRRKNEQPAHAIHVCESFIDWEIWLARQAKQRGDLAGAMSHLGMAMHAIMDKASPVHRDCNGLPLVWDGVVNTGWGHSPNEWLGKETKAEITSDIFAQQDKALNDAYDRVFK